MHRPIRRSQRARNHTAARQPIIASFARAFRTATDVDSAADTTADANTAGNIDSNDDVKSTANINGNGNRSGNV